MRPRIASAILARVRGALLGMLLVEMLAAQPVALPGPVLAAAALRGDRLLLLFPDALGLYRLDPGGLLPLAREPLPGPRVTARGPAGLLRLSAGDATCWALANTSARSALFLIEPERLLPVQEADALPWPGAQAGLRFRTGTNRIDGLGEQPLIALADGLGVTPDGRLAGLESDAPRVGSALARLDQQLLAASSARPPGEADALVVIDLAHGGSVESPVQGTLRALAAVPDGPPWRVLGIVEASEGGATLVTWQVRR
jgi:hypothetical protein